MLFVMRHRGTGRLFPVAQRCVENQDMVLFALVCHGFGFPLNSDFALALFTSERSRPMARSEADKKQQAPEGCQTERARGKRVLGRGKRQAPVHGARL
jgi:hypothetical protein